MPVLDTEILFALNPKDPKHDAALKLLNELRQKGRKIFVPDTVMLEFQIVLRSIGKKLPIVKTSILGLRKAIEVNRGEEVNTINSTLLARQCEIEEKYGLTYFDSLIAASTLSVDEELISDDNAFDRVPGIRRASLSSKSRV